MSDIFHEVEEDVRREHYEALWKTYGHYLLGLMVVFIVGVAVWQWYQSYDRGRRMATSDAYQAADALATAGNYVGAEIAFNKLSQDGTTGYRTISRFRQAEMMLAQGKANEAATRYRDLAALSDKALAESARIRLAWLEADVSSRDVLEEDLKPLSGADSPWRYMAEEVLAYYDLRHGARDKAMAAYQKLSQEVGAPQGVRVRSAAFAEYIKANPGVDLTPALAPIATAPTSPAPSSPSSAATPSATTGAKAPAAPVH